jgi:hypothetical protein
MKDNKTSIVIPKVDYNHALILHSTNNVLEIFYCSENSDRFQNDTWYSSINPDVLQYKENDIAKDNKKYHLIPLN